MGLLPPVAVAPPGDDVTVYEVIGELPSEKGGANATVAWPSPECPCTSCGRPGGAFADCENTQRAPRATGPPSAGPLISATAPSLESAIAEPNCVASAGPASLVAAPPCCVQSPFTLLNCQTAPLLLL